MNYGIAGFSLTLVSIIYSTIFSPVLLKAQIPRESVWALVALTEFIFYLLIIPYIHRLKSRHFFIFLYLDALCIFLWVDWTGAFLANEMFKQIIQGTLFCGNVYICREAYISIPHKLLHGRYWFLSLYIYHLIALVNFLLLRFVFGLPTAVEVGYFPALTTVERHLNIGWVYTMALVLVLYFAFNIHKAEKKRIAIKFDKTKQYEISFIRDQFQDYSILIFLSSWLIHHKAIYDGRDNQALWKPMNETKRVQARHNQAETITQMINKGYIMSISEIEIKASLYNIQGIPYTKFGKNCYWMARYAKGGCN